MEPEVPAVAPVSAVTETAAFDQLIARLHALSHNHLLYFRIEVGRAVLEELYDGDVAALRDNSPNKPRSLRDFARVHAGRLADLGLNELLLRKSIDAHLVVAHLPEEVVRKLVFTHVVQLAQIDDTATRLVLARAAAENGWSGAELQDAMARISAGLWIDADPATPGLQPTAPGVAPPPEPEKKLPPGRVVSRVEKGAAAFAATTAQWDDLPVEALTAAQRARVERALDEAEARISAMRRRLG
jgi:hypothetical protein